MDDRLYRSTTDRSLAGVCGGLAAWMGIDPSLIRIAWVLLSLMSGGVFVLLYIVLAIVVPDAPPGWAPRGRPQGPGGWAGPSWGPGGPSGGPGPGPNAPGGAWTGGAWSGGTPGSGWTGAGPGTWTPPTPPREAPPPGWEHRWRGNQASLIAGIVLIALGIWFLVRDYVPINWDLVWPVAVIVLGGLLIWGAMRRGR